MPFETWHLQRFLQKQVYPELRGSLAFLSTILYWSQQIHFGKAYDHYVQMDIWRKVSPLNCPKWYNCFKQGGDDVKFLSSEAWIFHRNFNLPQDQLFRELRPRFYCVLESIAINTAFPPYSTSESPSIFLRWTYTCFCKNR